MRRCVYERTCIPRTCTRGSALQVLLYHSVCIRDGDDCHIAGLHLDFACTFNLWFTVGFQCVHTRWGLIACVGKMPHLTTAVKKE